MVCKRETEQELAQQRGLRHLSLSGREAESVSATPGVTRLQASQGPDMKQILQHNDLVCVLALRISKPAKQPKAHKVEEPCTVPCHGFPTNPLALEVEVKFYFLTTNSES